MSKTKEKNGSGRSTTSEWLRESRRTHDHTILRTLISKVTEWQIETSQLDIPLFEKTYGLSSIPKTAVSNDMLNRALGHERIRDEIKISMRKVQPKGKTLVDQIKSLLPELPESEIESLSYAFGRIVSERIPKETRLPFIPEGLDALTAALLNLYIISSTVQQDVPWLLTLWKLKIKEVKIAALESIYDSLSRDADRSSIQDVMEKAIRDINIALGQDPMMGVALAQDPLSGIIGKWIMQVSSKTSDLQIVKTQLRETVTKNIADIKGFSEELETEIDVHSTPVTNWDILALRSDGPTAHAHESLLQLLRGEINILRYDAIRKMCINFSLLEEPGHPTLVDLNQVSKLTGRSAYYEMQRLEPLFNERYIPTLRKIGLRYRFIFTPRQRPGVLSDGLIERMILIAERENEDQEEQREKSTAEGNHFSSSIEIRGCTVHIEPNWSRGPNPRKFQKGTYEAVVEDEIVSLNLNHFDLKRGVWVTDIQDKPKGKQKDSLLLQRSTISEDNKPFPLSARQAELIGLLWSLQGPQSQRKWLLDSVSYPHQTRNRMLKIMLDNQVLRLLYLPALEFCGLPDGLIVYANCIDRKSRDRFVDYIVESQPYARIFIGDSNDVVARIRTPLNKSDSVAGNLKEKLPKFSDQFFTARLRSAKTYRIVTIHKLREPKTGNWTDPWKDLI